MPDASAPDPEKLRDYARHVFGMMSGATVAGMIYLGDRLGLYQALAGAGPLDASDLAARTGLDERWVREWLYTQGAGGVLEFAGDDRFALSPEGEAVLVNDAHHVADVDGGDEDLAPGRIVERGEQQVEARADRETRQRISLVRPDGLDPALRRLTIARAQAGEEPEQQIGPADVQAASWNHLSPRILIPDA